MKKSFFLYLFLLTSCIIHAQESNSYKLVLHGGAGYMTPENLPLDLQNKYRSAIDSALIIGQNVLANNGSALDAVQETIMYLENNQLFNAGHGAVYTLDGNVELDASIMDGKTLNAGAITGVRTVKNPILAARAVLDSSEHVLLSGEGADGFAKEQNIQIVPNNYFKTKANTARYEKQHKIDKHGTVGVAALDNYGNMAAGTSTGGMENKAYNRIGDSPIIGAGTYANNKTCAISCTGHGEYFIRYVVAYDISAIMEYKGYSITDAANEVVQGKLKAAGGNGGIIGIDKNGHVAMVTNTSGMFRGWISASEKYIAIFDFE